MNFQEQDRLDRARKNVECIKAFYIHTLVYVIVNAFILVNIFQHTDHFWQLRHFFTLIFWGLGLALHGFRVFGISLLFSKDWEKQQIQKYMDKDRHLRG